MSFSHPHKYWENLSTMATFIRYNKHFKYDAVAQQKRQVGSTFKPFVYATAINQLRKSPCDELPNTPYTIPKGKYGIPEEWTPKNFALNSIPGLRSSARLNK